MLTVFAVPQQGQEGIPQAGRYFVVRRNLRSEMSFALLSFFEEDIQVILFFFAVQLTGPQNGSNEIC